MITVRVPTAPLNTHREWYVRNKKSELITIDIYTNGTHIEVRLAVDEAEKLAKDLMEWIKEIKDEEEAAG